MKIRTGFVSNSSSSSFVIFKDKINSVQEVIIKNYLSLVPLLYHRSQDLGFVEDVDGWYVEEDDSVYMFGTNMDNFDLISFFKLCSIEISDYKDEYNEYR